MVTIANDVRGLAWCNACPLSSDAALALCWYCVLSVMEDQGIAKIWPRRSIHAKVHTGQLQGAEVCQVGVPGRYGGGMTTKEVRGVDHGDNDMMTYEDKAAKVAPAKQPTRTCNQDIERHCARAMMCEDCIAGQRQRDHPEAGAGREGAGRGAPGRPEGNPGRQE